MSAPLRSVNPHTSTLTTLSQGHGNYAVNYEQSASAEPPGSQLIIDPLSSFWTPSMEAPGGTQFLLWCKIPLHFSTHLTQR